MGKDARDIESRFICRNVNGLGYWPESATSFVDLDDAHIMRTREMANAVAVEGSDLEVIEIHIEFGMEYWHAWWAADGDTVSPHGQSFTSEDAIRDLFNNTLEQE